MNEYFWPIITYFIGLPSALAWTMLVYAINEHKALQAACWDAIVIAAGCVATLTIWSQSGDDWRVLVAWMLGNCTGTYINVSRKRRQKDLHEQLCSDQTVQDKAP